MKNWLVFLVFFLFIFGNLINFTTQFQTAAEMRAFQMQILKGFQEFAVEATSKTRQCKNIDNVINFSF